MSYRDMRDFTEIMRVIRYPRMISIESFRKPNFELVADILYWIVQRYDPDIVIHGGIESEEERVIFINGIAKCVYDRANIQLDTKKLYSADGYAVKELLKLAKVVSTALDVVSNEDTSLNFDLSSISTTLTKDAKIVRALASEVTESAAKLHDLILQENENCHARDRGMKYLSAATEGMIEDGNTQNEIEQILVKKVEENSNSLERLEQEQKILISDNRDLNDKIEKKTVDFERNQRRLQSLKEARPTFMDEFEQLELELQAQYELYMERFRNVHYLKSELETYKKSEEIKLLAAKRSMKKVQQTMREEELKMLRVNDDDLRINEDMKGRSGQESSREQMTNSFKEHSAVESSLVSDSDPHVSMRGSFSGDSQSNDTSGGGHNFNLSTNSSSFASNNTNTTDDGLTPLDSTCDSDDNF